MELQITEHQQIQLDQRKFSHNTCPSSSSNSPNSDFSKQEDSGIKYLNAFSTGTQSPRSTQSPDKAFFSLSIPTLTSLQKRSNYPSSCETINEPSSLQTIRNQMECEMEEEHEENGKNSMETEITESDKNLLASGRNEANIKCLELAHQNKNLNMVSGIQSGCNSNQKKLSQSSQNTNDQTLNSTHGQPTTSTTVIKDTRPLPTYPQARPALYIWIRSLCHQMNMCFDVFALTMRYLDQYHLTYSHPYNRYTFTINAYGMIILASKMMNKQILTPRLIAEKIFVSKQQMESIEMDLVRMMNFQLYFETFVKQLQKKMEQWEQIIDRIGLKEELTLFGENINSFKRLYSLIREVQIMAKVNCHITEPMLLTTFIKALGKQFKIDYKASIFFSEILCEIFALLLQENPQIFNVQSILDQINSQIDTQNDETWTHVKENFQRRNNKELYQNYNVFLNSIFVMKA